jgi:hypothetical protein
MPHDDVFEVEQPQVPGVQKILRGLTEDYVALERRAQDMDKQAKNLKNQRDEVAARICRMLSELGQTSTKWEDGLMVVRKKESYLSCPSEHKEKFERWLKDSGYWALAKIPAAAVKKILRDRVANDRAVPEYLRTFEKEGVQVRNKNVLTHGKEDEDGSETV